VSLRTICHLFRTTCATACYKKVQLSLTNPRDAKPCQKVLQFDVETSYRQLKNFFEVMEIRCLVIKFLIQFQLPSELLEKRTKKFIHDYDKFAAPLIYSDAHCG